MNAFDAGRQVEARSIAILSRFLDDQGHRWVLTSKGTLARYIQETIGDFITNDPDGRMWTVECKSEESRRYGNFFLETWSNKNLDDKENHARHGSTVGWMQKLRCDLLFYHFLSEDELYIIDFFKLKRWAFGGPRPRLSEFSPERRQTKREQLNDTWGRCVPIELIRREVGFHLVNPLQIPLPGIMEAAE